MIAQRYLFRNIVIRSEAGAKGILGLVTGSPNLVPHIRVLTVDDWDFGLGGSSAAQFSVLHELIPCLQHVTELRLYIHDEAIQILGALFATLRSMDSLSVIKMRDSDREKGLLAVFLNHFPCLRSLRLKTFPLYIEADDEGTMLATPAPAFALSDLEIGMIYDG